VFWVISVYFNTRNTLPKSGTFLLGHPVYIYVCVCVCLCVTGCKGLKCFRLFPEDGDQRPKNVGVDMESYIFIYNL